jgi:hypothetical protein
MKNILLLSAVLLVATIASGQSDLEKLYVVNIEFQSIDSCVLLMEEISDLSLRNSLMDIKDLADKNPVDKIRLTNMLSSLNYSIDNLEKKTFGRIVFTYLNHKESLLPTFSNAAYEVRIHQLYHHAKRLFEYIVGDGKVFDENLLNIYYQFRNELRQFIEIEKMKQKLTTHITVLQGEISVLCDSVISVRSLMTKQYDSLKLIIGSTKALTEDQQRDERVSQLVTRRKWRYLAATKLSKQQLDGITYGKDRKAARKELKKALK